MKNLITRVLLALRKYYIRIVLFSIVFFVSFCFFSYVRSFQSASVILAFTYPNASDGLYPNGTYFNAYNIFTHDVLQNAIHNAGLDGYVNPHKLAEEITIRPRNSASLITTQFIVSYSAGSDDLLGAVSAEGLLNSIIYTYIDHFHGTYRNDQIVLSIDIIDKENLDYIDQVDYFNVVLNQLQKYLSAQQVSDKDFVSDDGTSFQDLMNIIDQYRTTTLKEIRSIISERGVTRDRSTYLDRLDYRIWNYTNNYEYNNKMHQLYKNILQNYEARLTSVVFIPSLDSQRKFYMSKTKVGIDIYATKATDFEETAEEVQRLIKQSDQQIIQIKDNENTATVSYNTIRADSLIADLERQLDRTMEKIREVEKEYSQYKNHNYVTMTPRKVSIMERTGAKSAVVLTAILDVVLVAFLVVHMARKQDKKGKESE